MKKKILMVATMVGFLGGFNVSAARVIDPNAQAYVDQLVGLSGEERSQIVSDVIGKLAICQAAEGNCEYYQDILNLLDVYNVREAK